MSEVKVASFKRNLSILHSRLDEVSYFLDEVKESRSPVALAGRINDLKKMFKEKNLDIHQMELKSKTSSSTTQSIKI